MLFRSYPAYRLVVIGVGLAMALLLYLLVTRTRAGMWVRAGASDREMAEVMGVDTRTLFTFVFVVGAALSAVAGALAARRYGLDVVAERIEDEPHNQTRFLLVARDATAPPPDVPAKTTLRLKLPHRPGTLARALAPFAEAGLNLTKLESRPDRSTPWEYLFYLDVEARADEPAMRAARAALAAQGAVITLLGEYARFAPRA